jgi:hypothetical protein
MTKPLSEEDIKTLEHLFSGDHYLGAQASRGACDLVVRLIAEVRRSRQPAGRTYVEIATAWIAERPAWDRSSAERDAQSLARLLEATERAAVEKAAKIAEQRRDEWAPEVKHDVNKCSLCALARHKSDEAGWIAAAIRKAQP